MIMIFFSYAGHSYYHWGFYDPLRNIGLYYHSCSNILSLLSFSNSKIPELQKNLNCIKLGNSMPSPRGLLIDGQIITDHKCMSNVFNNYFTSIGQELASKLPLAPPFIPSETPEIPAFTFPSVTAEFVQKQL